MQQLILADALTGVRLSLAYSPPVPFILSHASGLCWPEYILLLKWWLRAAVAGNYCIRWAITIYTPSLKQWLLLLIKSVWKRRNLSESNIAAVTYNSMVNHKPNRVQCFGNNRSVTGWHGRNPWILIACHRFLTLHAVTRGTPPRIIHDANNMNTEVHYTSMETHTVSRRNYFGTSINYWNHSLSYTVFCVSLSLLDINLFLDDA